MKFLIVVAHPDDEVLGCGASIYKWTKKGDTVDVCIMSAEAKARAFRPEDNELDVSSKVDFHQSGIEKGTRERVRSKVAKFGYHYKFLSSF